MKIQKGVGLFEVIATLAIIAILVTVALPLLRGTVNDTAQLALFHQQAKEMSQLKKAVAGWAALHEDTMTKDITISPAISEFIDAGLLQEGFAQSETLDPTTRGTPPLGGDYSVHLRNEKINGKYVLRGVIIDEGSQEQTKLLKAGMQSTSASGYNALSKQWVSRVNLALLDQFNTIGGLNPSGTKTATGSIESFELDITDFVPTTNSQRARSVVFYGFVGIEGLHDPTAPPPPIINNVSFCSMVLPTGADAVCPLGQIEITKLAVCDRDLPTITGLPEISGAVTWGYNINQPLNFTTSGLPSEYVSLLGLASKKKPIVRYYDTVYYRNFSMNKAFVGSVECAKLAWHSTAYQNQPYSRPHSHYSQFVNTPNAAVHCTEYLEKTYIAVSSTSTSAKINAYCLDKTAIISLLKPGDGPSAAVCCLPN